MADREHDGDQPAGRGVFRWPSAAAPGAGEADQERSEPEPPPWPGATVSGRRLDTEPPHWTGDEPAALADVGYRVDQGGRPPSAGRAGTGHRVGEDDSAPSAETGWGRAGESYFDPGGRDGLGGWGAAATAAADAAGWDDARAVSEPAGLGTFATIETPAWREGHGAGLIGADLMPRGRERPAATGWRRAVHQASGGLLRPGESAAQRGERELLARAGTPVAGHHRVAVLSLKGGVGKTTTAMGLGLTLAALRADRVIAVDANPDRGTLCDKLRLETAATIRDLVSERDQISCYADVRAYTTSAAGRLEVLASDRDPTMSVAFSAEDYLQVAQVLERFYSICITDCGTGLLHSAMRGVLSLADQIVLVSTPSVDGARSASATLDWLAAHGHGALARSAVVVLSMVRRRNRTSVDVDRLAQHFAARCRAVVRIPHDPHLEEGAEMELAALHKLTADAYLRLAAEVGDGFARRSASQ